MVLKDNRCVLSTAIILALTAAAITFDSSHALRYTVGDSVWAIPPNPDFYTNWSSSHFFLVGDSLLFDFESDYYDVVQVSRREYDSCTAENPFQAFTTGPAVVPLIEKGAFYFICSIGNYCALGQKLAVTVYKQKTGSAPILSPSPLPASLGSVSPSLAPLASPEQSAGSRSPEDSRRLAPSPAGNDSSSTRRSRVGFSGSGYWLSSGVVLGVILVFS